MFYRQPFRPETAFRAVSPRGPAGIAMWCPHVGVRSLLVGACLLLATSPETAIGQDLEVLRAVRAIPSAWTSLGDPSTTSWRRTPGMRSGRRLGDMTAAERDALDVLLRDALTPRGFARVSEIIRHDDLLKAVTPQEPLGSTEYFFAVFGTPGVDERWGWRLEGHHVSVRRFWGGRLGSTPVALGMDYSTGTSSVLMGREEAVQNFVRSLTADQLRQAAEVAQGPRARLISEVESAPPLGLAGFPIETLTVEQRSLLENVVEDFVGDVIPRIAPSDILDESARVSLQQPSDLEGLLYFRISTNDHVIELQNIGAHIHSVWRSRWDFGR